MWWDSDVIEATVTRQFVCSHLLPEEIERLDRPLGFGDGLTDGTYWEWIDEKAKRIFLILVDLGVPDQIFGVIDDSWDDQDLPIAHNQVERLALTPVKDEKLERKFYYRQYHYLLQPLLQGEHVVYEDVEVVPLDVVERKQGLAVNHSVDKVVIPGHPGISLCRRRIPLESGPGSLSYEDFLYEINSIRTVQNEHLVSYFASYVHQGYGYVLLTPVADSNLKSFLATTPATFKNLAKKARRELVLNWIHCLVDTITFLHNRGLSHGNIKPSTILLTSDHHIFLSDFSRLNPDLLPSTSQPSFSKESYDYAAPEQWFRPTSSAQPPTPTHRRSIALTHISSSPDSTSFSISRSNTLPSSTDVTLLHNQPTPHLSPQAADIFSLGCVILELLTLLLKKTPRAFAAHRAARHKTPGRGGAVLDSSFHKNLGQVESWMAALAREADKKGRDDGLFRGVAPMLRVVERMLSLHPGERPAAGDVLTRMYEVLHDVCGVGEPHCVHRYGGLDFGFGGLAIRTGVGARRSSVLTGGSGLEHRRTNSGGSGSGSGSGRASVVGSHTGSYTGSNSSSAGECSVLEQPLSPRLRQEEIGSGLRAIQSLRVRTDSARQWERERAVGVGY